MQGQHKKQVIVALDYPTADQAVAMAKQLDPSHCRLKVGKELFTRSGPAVVEQIQQLGFDVFLDLKFHDIPNTVAAACRAAAEMGVWMVNVHALGGQRMMAAAREAIESTSQRPLLTAVTILTSMESADLVQVGLNENPQTNVLNLAKLAQTSGLDGVVCSAQEATLLRQQLNASFQLVTPGVRPAGSEQGDQRRIMTPREAVNAGANYLVIGRPITQSPNPVKALQDILNELDAQ